MTWNHRVIVTQEGDQHCYRIHEVFYDETGNPTSWTKEPISAFGDSMRELRKDLDLLRCALFRPALICRQRNGQDCLEVADDDGAHSLDEFHRHEALDRAFVFIEQFTSHVASHPVISTDADLSDLSNQIEEVLGELYQRIGGLKNKSIVNKSQKDKPR
jgi:hypothetical protein